ncbi:unnamed protein product [Lactuca saligna]|uniref:F-box domain-containing protein n=1 Tax=Lactuca saligna TaxID=75948 RepID=A0AA36E6N5_LACSI|nr:unnamed protein product [Lactuca saligna]
MKKSKPPKALKCEDGVDLISNMPDAILVLILSRLKSTKTAIRSSILSRRWRNLWTAVPSVDIQDGEKFKKNKFKEFVYWVLASKTVDLDSFRLRCDGYYNMSTVLRWIHMALTRNVKQLDLTICTKENAEAFELPHCLLKTLNIYCEDRRCCDIKISCPKLVVLNLEGDIACNLFFERLDSLKQAMIEATFEGNSVPVLFHGNSHVKPFWKNLYFLCKRIDGACDLALPNLKTAVLKTAMDAFTVDELIQILKYCPKLENLKLIITKDFNEKHEFLYEDGIRRIMTPDAKRVEFLELNREKPKLVMDWCEGHESTNGRSWTELRNDPRFGQPVQAIIKFPFCPHPLESCSFVD